GAPDAAIAGGRARIAALLATAPAEPGVVLCCAWAALTTRLGDLASGAGWLARARAQASDPPRLRDAEAMALAEARLAAATGNWDAADRAYGAAIGAQQQGGRHWYASRTQAEREAMIRNGHAVP
ncbi:MAG TPA: hypothetical protein VM536_16920, partial [Chloroflexia bacterium]|nr:hypothetical protein [Chloroflexia bacterium]